MRLSDFTYFELHPVFARAFEAAVVETVDFVSWQHLNLRKEDISHELPIKSYSELSYL
jgi:hypothetical protein